MENVEQISLTRFKSKFASKFGWSNYNDYLNFCVGQGESTEEIENRIGVSFLETRNLAIESNSPDTLFFKDNEGNTYTIGPSYLGWLEKLRNVPIEVKLKLIDLDDEQLEKYLIALFEQKRNTLIAMLSQKRFWRESGENVKEYWLDAVRDDSGPVPVTSKQLIAKIRNKNSKYSYQTVKRMIAQIEQETYIEENG